MDTIQTASARVRVFSTKRDSWHVASDEDPPEHIRLANVSLEINGGPEAGFHLVMTPEGCFTADVWFATLLEALAEALEVFGVDPDGWASESRRQ